MVQIGCHETSVRNYHYSLRNNPKDGTDRFSETSVRNYHYSLRNNSEEHSSILSVLKSFVIHTVFTISRHRNEVPVLSMTFCLTIPRPEHGTYRSLHQCDRYSTAAVTINILVSCAVCVLPAYSVPLTSQMDTFGGFIMQISRLSRCFLSSQTVFVT
jgi:hypothetical protein